MTLTWLELLSVLGVPFALGAGVLRALGIRPAHERLAWAGWAWTSGSLAMAALLFAWLALGLPLDARWLVPALLGVAAGAFLFGRRAVNAGFGVGRARPAAGPAEEGLFALVVVLVLAVALWRILMAGAEPVMIGDEASIWAFKAKAIAQAGGFGEQLIRLAPGHVRYGHLDYPLLDPLLQVWAFAHAEALLHVENRLPVQLAAVALLLVLAAGLRRRARPALAAGLLLMVLPLQQHTAVARSCMADLLVALGVLVAFDALLRWRETGEARWWRLHAVGLAVAVASKNEGGFYLLAFLAAGAICWAQGRFRHSDLRSLFARAAWLLIPAGALLATWLFNHAHGYANDLVSGGPRGTPPWQVLTEDLGQRLGPVLAFLGGEVALDPLWSRMPEVIRSNFLWPLFALLAILSPRVAFAARLRPATWTLLLLLAGYVLIYLATPRRLDWHLATSAERIVFQSLPCFALWIGVVGQVALGSAAETVSGSAPPAPVR